MKPVMQTKFHFRDNYDTTTSRGNCFQSCVASILEFPLESVPNWSYLNYGRSNWKLAIHTWFNCYNLQIITVPKPSDDDDKYYIVSGPSPRFPDGSVQHSCVWYKGKIVHDPHYDNSGLIECTKWQLITKVFDYGL